MNEQGKTAMLIPYYGPLPDWLEYTLQSISQNPQFDFIIISDTDPPFKLPVNVNHYRMSIDDFARRMEHQLDIKPDIRHPYKLTDFKPALALLFEDLLRDYQYWGYADLDLVLGKVSRFISDKTMIESDIISPSSNFYPGHFMIFRNSEAVRILFREADSWHRVFKDHRCYCFDEFIVPSGMDPGHVAVPDFTSRRVRKHLRRTKLRKNPILRIPVKMLYGIRSRVSSKLEDFNSVLISTVKNERMSAYREDMYMDDVMLLEQGIYRAEIQWKDGRLFCNDREILYYHFQLAKSSGGFDIKREAGNSFKISINLQAL
jgi:hypothetical protein